MRSGSQARRRRRFRRITLLLLPAALRRQPRRRVDRVLHVLFSRHDELAEDPFSLRSGGGTRFALEVGRHMASRKRTRLILCSTGANRLVTPEGLEIRVLPSTELRDEDPWTWRLLPHLLWADVVHCHQYEQIGAAFFITLARLLGRRVYVTDLGAYQDRSFWHNHDLFRLVHGFLFMSHFSIDAVLPREHRYRATSVGGGIDPAIFFPRDSNGSRRGVVFVGRLLPHKGIDVLIRALPAGVSLRVVGPNEEKTRYLNLLERESHGKDVLFVGVKHGTELADEYRRAQVCVLPSVYEDCFGNHHPRSEFFGLVLAEAQACGTPVICTDVGGMPEAVRDRETGFVVRQRSSEELHGALLRLLNDGALWKRFSNAAADFARQELAWPRLVDRCLQAYEANPK